LKDSIKVLEKLDERTERSTPLKREGRFSQGHCFAQEREDREEFGKANVSTKTKKNQKQLPYAGK